jgi:p-hydroxybenzoate 3-monooxygenase
MDMKMAARRQVAIIGEAPAGLPLSHMLHRDGIDSILLERQRRIHVMERIRAGVLAAGTVELLREVGLGGWIARGIPITVRRSRGRGRPRFFIDTKKLPAKQAYRQIAITEDLWLYHDKRSGEGADFLALRISNTVYRKVFSAV